MTPAETFGSWIVPPGTGVVLNDSMDDFSLRPGVPKLPGVRSFDRNALLPGRRPLSRDGESSATAAPGTPAVRGGGHGGMPGVVPPAPRFPALEDRSARAHRGRSGRRDAG